VARGGCTWRCRFGGVLASVAFDPGTPPWLPDLVDFGVVFSEALVFAGSAEVYAWLINGTLVAVQERPGASWCRRWLRSRSVASVASRAVLGRFLA
jgi:hypothetical protein